MYKGIKQTRKNTETGKNTHYKDKKTATRKEENVYVV